MKLKLGDTVKVLIGKDQGRTGKIEKVLTKKKVVIVAGINQYKKHLKPREKNQPGGIIDVIKPMSVSKLALVCPQCKKPTRVGFQGEKKKKVRICKKCLKNI